MSLIPEDSDTIASLYSTSGLTPPEDTTLNQVVVIGLKQCISEGWQQDTSIADWLASDRTVPTPAVVHEETQSPRRICVEIKNTSFKDKKGMYFFVSSTSTVEEQLTDCYAKLETLVLTNQLETYPLLVSIPDDARLAGTFDVSTVESAEDDVTLEAVP